MIIVVISLHLLFFRGIVMEIDRSPGCFLRSERLKRSESLRVVARRSGIQRATLSMYERDKRKIPTKKLPLIGQTYGLDSRAYDHLLDLICRAEQCDPAARERAEYIAALKRLHLRHLSEGPFFVPKDCGRRKSKTVLKTA